MGKIIIYIMLFLATSLMATDIKWAKSYDEGMALAKKQNKPVLFIVSSNECKYCVLLDNTTLKDKKVTKGINRDFIAVRSWLNKGDYVPEYLYAPGLPTIWFLLPDGTPMFRPIMGMIDAKNFLKALAIVKTEFDTIDKGKKKR